MNGLVLELPSGSCQIADRRQARSARSHLDDLQLPDFATPHFILQRRVVGIKPSIEAEHRGNFGGSNHVHRLDRFLVIQTDRLFAVNGFAGFG